MGFLAFICHITSFKKIKLSFWKAWKLRTPCVAEKKRGLRWESHKHKVSKPRGFLHQSKLENNWQKWKTSHSSPVNFSSPITSFLLLLLPEIDTASDCSNLYADMTWGQIICILASNLQVSPPQQNHWQEVERDGLLATTATIGALGQSQRSHRPGEISRAS